jgi:hypothetical protein
LVTITRNLAKQFDFDKYIVYTSTMKTETVMTLPPNFKYVQMNNEDRDILYRQWCRQEKLDPDLEYSVYAFFDSIDRVPPEEEIEQ